ncbi:Peptidase inhibitor 16 [Cichlidogyrus casuarinus]|uniref:Peptidase inhibitor 16 n=1 Tax=Cichlidogyrus casuarinus TaxID=1844966 RepID=A0ABD2Q674_9PLAT
MSFLVIEYIKQVHEIARSEVNPPASNMQFLVWNETLQELASKLFRNQCNWNDIRDTAKAKNLGFTVESVPADDRIQANYKSVADKLVRASWKSYSKRYPIHCGSKFTDECNNYRQVVSAHTNTYGCHFNFCEKLAWDIPPSMALVCFYHPP